MPYIGNQKVEVINEYPHTVLIRDARGCKRTVSRRAVRDQKSSDCVTYDAVAFQPPEPPDVVADKKLTAAGRASLRGQGGGFVIGNVSRKGSIKKPTRDE